MDRHPGVFKNTRSANTAASISRASRVFASRVFLKFNCTFNSEKCTKNKIFISIMKFPLTFLRPHAQYLSKARARSSACTLFYDNVK